LGVFSRDFISPLVEGLKLLDANRAMVVSSFDGMDEISICDNTYAQTLTEDEFVLNPTEYGLQKAQLEAIIGGDAVENAKITMSIFDGIEQGAKKDIVLLNSACAFVVDEKARDIKDGLEMAREAIDSKRAKEHLKKIVEVSQKLS